MKATKTYRQIVTVHVSSVPLDMMRYDNCVPATEQEAGKLERIALQCATPEDHTVTFRRFSNTPEGPTAGRWASFNCRIVEWRAA